MKTVIVATAWKRCLLTNYGSFFQHYALRRYLKELGYTPIRLSNPCEHYGLNYLMRTLIGNLSRALSPHPRDVGIGREIVEAFREVLMIWRFRRTYRELIGPEHEHLPVGAADVFLAGSDQVWTESDAMFWGDDMPDSTKRISYAASADWHVCENNSRWQEKVPEKLGRYLAVSVREAQGAELLKKVSRGCVPIVRVVDPVYLLSREDYCRLASPRRMFRKRTLFCYLVNIHRSADDLLRQICRLADAKGLDVCILGTQDAQINLPSKLQKRLGPRDFIRCMRDADYVITNSFHGIVFCTIFRKDFLVVAQTNLPGTDQNARQREVLRYWGLEDRMFDASQLNELTPVRWDADVSNDVLRSKKWLKDNLSRAIGADGRH